MVSSLALFLASLIVKQKFYTGRIEKALLLFFILSIASSAISSEPERALFYSFYWLSAYLAIANALNVDIHKRSSKKAFLRLGSGLILVELLTRIILNFIGLNYGLHSLASLSLVLLLFIGHDLRFFTYKYIAIVGIVITSSFKIYIALFFHLIFRMLNIWLILIGSIVTVSIFIYTILPIIDAYEDTLGKIWHMSGRTSIWAGLIAKLSSYDALRVVFGDGYHVGHRIELNNMSFYNAHNIWLSAFLNNGLLGLFFLILLFLKRLRSLRPGIPQVYTNSLFLIFLITTLANSAFLSGPSLVGVVSLFIFIISLRKKI